MSKFSHIKTHRVKADVTAEYTLYQISVNGVSPTLIVKPATELNKPYFNALLKRSARTARRAASGKIDAATIAQNRAEDRQLYPQHVVTGWTDVIGDDGKEVPFSKEDCADFLAAVDDWVFDDLRNFCGTPTNFTSDDEIEVSAEDGEAKGKN